MRPLKRELSRTMQMQCSEGDDSSQTHLCTESYPAHDSRGEREGAVAEASKVSLQLSSHEKMHMWV